MAYLTGQPFMAQFIDPATGLLMASGTIEFYLTGTSTPTPYYTDSSGTSGGTSITLDAGGKPPNNIFFDDGITYKIVVKDAAGTTLETIDPYNVSGPTSAIKRQYVADMTSESATAGDYFILEDYASGRDAGPLFFKCVAGTGTDDGGSVINHDTLNLRFEQDFPNGEYWVEQWGAEPSADSTTAIQNAIDYASNKNAVARAQVNEYWVTGLDLSAPGTGLVGSGNPEYRCTNIKIVGTATLTASSGKTVGILLNDNTATSYRGGTLEKIAVLEGSSTDANNGMRYYGVYGINVPHFKMASVLTDGFENGMLLSYFWDADIDSINCVNFRYKGFSTKEEDLLLTSTNGNMIGNIRCSTNVATASYNFDFSICNSINIASLVTEGSALNHIRVSTATQGLNINTIHKESQKNLIIYDADYGAPGSPGGSVSIWGGSIFDCGGAGQKILATEGTLTSSRALYSLTLGALTIVKQPTTTADHFDMSRVQVFSTHAIMSYYSADTAIDRMTWYNVGAGLHSTYNKVQQGHAGVARLGNYGTYTGRAGEFLAKQTRDFSSFLLKNITNITQANPAVVTSSSHGLTNGNIVYIENVSGMTEVNNNYYVVSNATANTFELQGINSTGYTAYTSGGYAYKMTEIVYNINTGVEITYEIDVTVEHNSGAASGNRYWARFMVFQTVDDTLITTLLHSNDSYAVDAKFGLDVANSRLVYAGAQIGTHYIKIKSSLN